MPKEVSDKPYPQDSKRALSGKESEKEKDVPFPKKRKPKRKKRRCKGYRVFNLLGLKFEAWSYLKKVIKKHYI